MKTHWIHFIGKSYYSLPRFIKESEAFGISRAVSFSIFKKMEFGDRIILAQKDGSSTKIFGYFDLTQVIGLGQDTYDELKKSGAVQVSNNQPTIVVRGCGTYIISSSSTVTDGRKFMDIVKNSDPKGHERLMIGGSFHRLPDLGIDEAFILSNIPFQMGYRLFNFETFKEAYQASKNRSVKGQFYQNERHEPIFIEDKSLLMISNYKLN